MPDCEAEPLAAPELAPALGAEPGVAPGVAPAPDGVPAVEPLGLEPLLAPAAEPIVALANIHWGAPVDALAVAPAVPAVPVAVGGVPPRCRHPVTVIVRLASLPLCGELD
jgi:hypothetical protein